MVHVLNRARSLLSKLKSVGISRFIRVVHNRIRKRIYVVNARKKAVSGTHKTEWKEFCKKYRLRDDCLDRMPDRSLDFIDDLIKDCDKNVIISCADEYANSCFDLLGSGKQCFDRMPWHKDFRLYVQDKQADCLFDATLFYDDIRITSGETFELSKDIKIPWELSRFHHLPVLAFAYRLTGNDTYAHVAKQHIDDWLDNNTYLFGVNWMCPMEVAIRATNWIVAWQWLKDPLKDDERFCKRLICSLYDHMRYLENNWELYDGRTSNHYLSNLVGYFYLCWFFDGITGTRKKRAWCYKELIREFDWQIFDEGTSYEGSTCYHGLVTELMIHVFLLALRMGIKVADVHQNKLERMMHVIEWCKPTDDGDVVVIGDDDSGSLLHREFFGLKVLVETFYKKPNGAYGIKHYKKFGLSVVKTSDWHVTLRYHAYTDRQPSGHFHNDMASVTLAYKGIPILIDPGSYVYTASGWWRNRFRSAKMHNIFYLKNHEPVFLDNQLFSLNIPPSTTHCADVVTDDGFCVGTKHALYPGLQVEREVVVVPHQCSIIDLLIIDSDSANNEPVVWNFIFAPDITLKRNTDDWIIVHQQKPLLKMRVPFGMDFVLYDAWMAPHYGSKQPTVGLRATKRISNEKQIISFCDFYV